MGKDLRTSLQELRQIVPQLNEAADEASALMREVENLLITELSLGITADVVVHTTNRSESVTEVVSLSHRRVNGKFRIAVAVERRTDFANQRYNCEDTAWEVISETPWAECSRELKLASFPKLPELLEEVVKNAAQSREQVDKAKAAVREILEPDQASAKDVPGRPMAGDKIGLASGESSSASMKAGNCPDPELARSTPGSRTRRT